MFWAGDHLFEGGTVGQVALESDHLLVASDGLGGAEEFGAELLGLDGGGGRDGAFGRAVLLEEIGGGLGADTCDAGDVVDGIADEGEPIGDEVRQDAGLGLDVGGGPDLLGLVVGIEDADAVIDELEEILVGEAMTTDQPRSAARRA